MERKDNLQPLVSIILATFNEPVDMISQSIRSVLDQDYPRIELIISDDSTEAATISAIDQFALQDKRVHIIRHKERMGFVNALNFALQASKGELIARMDGDDMSMPNRISLQVAYAQAHPDIDVFGGSMYIIDAENHVISERTYPTTARKINRMFMVRSPFAHPTLMFRRTIIDKGIMYNPEYKRAEDIDFYMRLYQSKYHFGNLPEKILKYRVVGNLDTKRPKEQWYYNHKARKRFIKSKPFFSCVSYLVSLGYKYVPNFIVARYYKKENSKYKSSS